MASFRAFPRIGNPSMAGLPMKVYGSSVESPQVVRFSSLVQKRAPVTRHVLQMCPDSSQKGM